MRCADKGATRAADNAFNLEGEYGRSFFLGWVPEAYARVHACSRLVPKD